MISPAVQVQGLTTYKPTPSPPLSGLPRKLASKVDPMSGRVGPDQPEARRCGLRSAIANAGHRRTERRSVPQGVHHQGRPIGQWETVGTVGVLSVLGLSDQQRAALHPAAQGQSERGESTGYVRSVPDQRELLPGSVGPLVVQFAEHCRPLVARRGRRGRATLPAH